MPVMVSTPARLHMGLLDLNGELGRLYGSIGVAIDSPKVVLEAETADSLIIEGLEKVRVDSLAQRFLEHYSLNGGVRLCLKHRIPPHIGLGSGTQLALAVGTALARLANLRLSIVEIAQVMRRGVHSGIGIGAFQHGGFILDGGHPVNRKGEGIPPVIFRNLFPEDWYFIVSVPDEGQRLSGQREQQTFQSLPHAPPSVVEKICRLLVMKLLPALVEKDVVGFGQALTGIQCLVGESFKHVQGGRYTHTLSSQLINHLLDRGAKGVGQSSWGPTVYALVKGEQQAFSLEKEAKEFLENHGEGQVFIARANNRGAQVNLRR